MNAFLLSGGLRALTRASSKSDQIRSGGKSYPITRDLLDLIIPFVLQLWCPQWLSHIGFILVLTRESVSRWDDILNTDLRTTATCSSATTVVPP